MNIETLVHELSILTPSESSKLQKQFQHSVSFYTLYGICVTHPISRENLFHIVTSMERYIVDSHASWQAESKKPQNQNKAFIIGRTISDETENLKALFFGDKVDTSNNNIFNLGVTSVNNEPLVTLERLDAHFQSVFDCQKLEEESKPQAKRTDTAFLQRRKKRLENVELEKKQILKVLEVSDIAQLAPRAELNQSETGLTAYIRENRSRCFGHWLNSMEVARCCYALLLIQSRKIRNEFALPDYWNVFHDTILIHNALFLKAKIFSGDFAPNKMASYIGDPAIVCLKKIT